MPFHDDHPGWTRRGYLPHCDHPSLVQAVTFRLADSMPQERRDEWEHIILIEDDVERIKQLESWLDKGAGSCMLRNPEVARIVQDALLHFDRKRYHLIAWCVMPNHVHALFEVLSGHVLGRIIHSWKTFTAREINKLCGRAGSLWQADYFDRFMRNEEHLGNEATYIEGNPVSAGLVSSAAEWEFSSAGFRASGS
ncbi:MAG: transposase [Verrucomicrobia bacterium]|nr:transposase [Verrucomicrobiota bacterium]